MNDKPQATTLAIRNAGESADMKVITLNKLTAKRKVKRLDLGNESYQKTLTQPKTRKLTSMMKSEKLDVQKFLEEIKVIDTEKSKVLIKIRQIIFDLFPKTDERIMYGGIVFFFNEEMFSGVFLNKKHVTVEFSKGFLMQDPHALLEGKGKYRRHLKLKSMEDIVNYNLAFFVQQAL